MPAEIFGDRFLGRRDIAWHMIGEVFDEPLGVAEAFRRAGLLDYHVEECDLFYRRGLFHPKAPGAIEQVEGRKALVRTPTPDDPRDRVFGVVAPNYRVIDNAEIADLLDPLGTKWPVETVGALAYGKTVFCTLDAGHAEVNGDDLHLFFLVSDTKDGQEALKITFTPVRVVCQNTLSTGLRDAAVTVNVRHSRGALVEAEGWVRLVHDAEHALSATIAIMRQMADRHMTHAEVQTVLEAVYPTPARDQGVLAYAEYAEEMEEADPTPAGERFLSRIQDAEKAHAATTARMEALRAGAIDLYTRFNDEYPAAAATPWALYNAVVELEDWRDGREQSIETSALFGARAERKARAFRVLRGV